MICLSSAGRPARSQVQNDRRLLRCFARRAIQVSLPARAPAVSNLVRGQWAARSGPSRLENAAVFGETRQQLPRIATLAPQRTRSVVQDPETDVAPGLPEAAIRVQNVDAQCVLQFTLLLADSCVLHRRSSRVIHR